jgi:DNA-binding CsgD family transcriptional regulator
VREDKGPEEFIALIDLIYEAALDSDLWPAVLIKLADAMGAGQAAMPSMDRRSNVVNTIAPRFDPDLLASWKEYWAFHDPVFARALLQPAGVIYALENLMPPEKFAATPVYNELWLPGELSLETAGANVLVEDKFSAMIYFSNAPGKPLSAQQMHIFATVLRHLTRAIRINRRLWELEVNRVAATERLDAMQEGALLVDASARVVRANAAAKTMLDDRREIFLDGGRLAAAGWPGALQRLIASCTRTSPSFARPAFARPAGPVFGGPGGELKIQCGPPRSPLHVVVMPLRSITRLADVPWIGAGAPVALVTVIDCDSGRQRQEVNLRRRFGLTAAESWLAAEILKGDGRVAAARRRGISDATAKTHLSRIFEKTGTHRQAELIRILLDATDARESDHESFDRNAN